MRNLFFASAAALALACGATAVSGQPSASLPSAAKMAYDSWPAESRAAYDSWPAEYQAYFWSLTPTQQKGWFALTDAQRKQVYDLPPASRATTWASIEQQLAGGAPPPEQVQANPPSAEPASPTPPNPQTAAEPVPPAQPADPSYQGGAYKGAMTAPPAEAMNKTYPVCTRKIQDSCRNPGGK